MADILSLRTRISAYIALGFNLTHDYTNETDIHLLEKYLELLRLKKRKRDNNVRLNTLLLHTIEMINGIE